MKRFFLFASTYATAETMKKHHESDYALELISRRISDPFHVFSDSPESAAAEFLISSQFEAFASRCGGKTLYIYYINDSDEIVQIG